jgi:hypothetical protein
MTHRTSDASDATDQTEKGQDQLLPFFLKNTSYYRRLRFQTARPAAALTKSAHVVGSGTLPGDVLSFGGGVELPTVPGTPGIEKSPCVVPVADGLEDDVLEPFEESGSQPAAKIVAIPKTRNANRIFMPFAFFTSSLLLEIL